MDGLPRSSERVFDSHCETGTLTIGSFSAIGLELCARAEAFDERARSIRALYRHARRGATATTVASSTRGADVKHEVKPSGAIVIIVLMALLGACRQPPGPEPPGDPPAPQSQTK